jgi:hypothetical protein
MSDFDPSEPSLVHDRRHNRTLPWSPDFRRSFERYAREREPGVIDYDIEELPPKPNQEDRQLPAAPH